MITGTIRKFISDRGFGFIKTDQGEDYFFHVTGLAVPFEPAEGQNVEFEIGIAERTGRACAEKIRLLQVAGT